MGHLGVTGRYGIVTRHNLYQRPEVKRHKFISIQTTLMCLSIGTPKNNKFSICSKWKIYYFWCPKIWAHYSLIIMCLNIGTPNNLHFPLGTNGKVVVLGVPILKHFRVVSGNQNVKNENNDSSICWHYKTGADSEI